ncbi:hypothetical protein, partial [Rubellimicrobium arenae]|uniref:hypothetical protein n=1 Tax=Rubellimicrobium arenae TaxID=2817372 RepID=UPI001B3156BA
MVKSLLLLVQSLRRIMSPMVWTAAALAVLGGASWAGMEWYRAPDTRPSAAPVCQPATTGQQPGGDGSRYKVVDGVTVGDNLFLLAWARDGLGVLCLDSGTDAWQPVGPSNPDWSEGNGWSDPANIGTFQTVGLGDQLYLLARADTGIRTLRFRPESGTWETVTTNSPDWSDGNGWTDPANYETIQAVGVGDDLYLLARANAGMVTLRLDRSKGTWETVTTNSPDWSDGNGWTDPANYETIQA